MREEQLYLENLYGEHTDILYLKEEVASMDEERTKLIELIEEYRSKTYSYDSKNRRIKGIEPVREADNLLVYILKSSRESTIQEGCSYLARSMPGELLDNIKNAADILAVTNGVVHEILKAGISSPFESHAIRPLYVVDDDLKEIIQNRQYMLPMVYKPDDWENNHNGGWLTKKTHVIHGCSKEDTQYVPLDVLNIMQKYRWILDFTVLQLDETPNKELDNPDKVKQFNQLKRASQEAYKILGSRPFHFVWRYDFRGRMYSQGYQVNLQSTKYKKALLSLPESFQITGQL